MTISIAERVQATDRGRWSLNQVNSGVVTPNQTKTKRDVSSGDAGIIKAKLLTIGSSELGDGVHESLVKLRGPS